MGLMGAECLCLDYSNQCVQDVFEKESKTQRTALHWAAQYEKPYCIEPIIKAGSYVDAKDSNGLSPLGLAAWQEDCKIINLLLDYGADTSLLDTPAQEKVAECLNGKLILYVDTH